MLPTIQADCDLLDLHHLSPPPPSPGKREKSDHDESSIGYRNLGCGFEQNCLVCGNRAVPIYRFSISHDGKTSQAARTLTFHSPDLFEDILAGDKKDIAGSHQLPRLHDDGRLEAIFHICCYPPLLRCEGNQKNKKRIYITSLTNSSIPIYHKIWKQHPIT